MSETIALSPDATPVLPSATQLLDLLRPRTLRCRTGILLLPSQRLGQERDLAVPLRVDALDYCEYLQERLTPDSSFVPLDAARLERDLDAIAQLQQGQNCVLVFNFDVALAKLPISEREVLWSRLRDSFPHRPRALILAIPQTAELLLPDIAARQIWEQAGRVALAV